MKGNVFIHNRQRLVRLNRRRIESTIRRLLAEEGCQRDVSLVFLDNTTIRKVNRRFLGRNRVTDVISFPLADIDTPGDNLLGEVFISAESARQEARRRRRPIGDELLLYCVHGVLHLLGYDDSTPTRAGLMRRREEQLVPGSWEVKG